MTIIITIIIIIIVIINVFAACGLTVMFVVERSAESMATVFKIHQRGVQWKQGVVMCTILYNLPPLIITPP